MLLDELKQEEKDLTRALQFARSNVLSRWIDERGALTDADWYDNPEINNKVEQREDKIRRQLGDVRTEIEKIQQQA